MRWLSTVSLWMVLASVGFCQQTPLMTDPPAKIVQPSIAASPRSSDAASASKVDHLLQAAKHLEQAGLTEEAAEYRRRAVQDRQAVDARIRQLEREIEDLRGLSSAGIQILAELKIIEIDQDELRALGLGEALFEALVRGLPENVRDSVKAGRRLANGNGPDPAAPMSGVLDSDAPVLGKLKAICDDKRAKVIAEPKLVTTSGRKAEVNIGADVPIRTPTEDGKMKTESRFVGTRWTVVPLVKPGGKLRLQMNASVSSLDPDKIDSADPSVPSPLRTFALSTALEILDGQTAVMTGPVTTVRAKSGDRRSLMLTLVTARIVAPLGDPGQYVPRPVSSSRSTRPLPPITVAR